MGVDMSVGVGVDSAYEAEVVDGENVAAGRTIRSDGDQAR